MAALVAILVRPAGAQPIEWTATERARIAAHGPWPPEAVFSRDPTNRVSGDPAAVEFGRLLFHDAPLSANGYIACVSCHQTDRAFTDGLPRGRALAPIDRNTIALANLRLQRWYGWGGSSDSIWMASLRAMLDEREMAVVPERVVRRFALNAELTCRYRRVFGRAPDHADDELLVNLAKSLAAFQETLVTGRTPFDEFRDAMLRNDRAAMARYPVAAQRGLRLFVGRANCALCHTGPNFSNGEFHDTGLPFFVRPGEVDPGRHAGLRHAQASPFNLLGRFNDDAARSTAVAIRHARLEHRHWGEWRTPSLRNVVATAPYMHDGSLATLRDVLRHYSELPEERLHADGERLLRRLDLADSEIDDLLAFLQTLSSAPPAPLPRSDPRAAGADCS
jgi:cytochrome c peroxidase